MIDAKATKKRGDFTLSAELHDEGFICLSGPNGAGKSTFLNVLSGIIPLDEGHVKIGSRDVTFEPTEKRRIVLVTPDSCIPHLTVEKHLTWGARLKHIDPDTLRTSKIKTALGIIYSGRLSKLSLGMRERVALATAVISEPEVILVDEGFSNIDRRQEFISEYRRLCSESRLDVIFTTQFPDDAKLADHQYSMESGKTKRIF